VIVAEQSAKAFSPLDLTVAIGGIRHRLEDDVAKALMVSFCVVVRDVLVDQMRR
jgi:hypothetical protein